MRLIHPSIDALDDGNPVLVDYVLENVLPFYGPVILPMVIRGLDINGGRGHAKRIGLIYALAGLKEKSIYMDAAEKGSQAVRISAIKALGNDPDSLDYILGLTKDRKKEIRQAALEAVSHNASQKVLDRLYEALCGKDYDIAGPAIKGIASEKLAIQILGEARRLLESLEARDTKPGNVERFTQCIKCLEGENLPPVYYFLEDSLIRKRVLYTVNIEPPEGSEHIDTAARLCANALMAFGTLEALQLVEGLCDVEGNHLIGFSFEASQRFRRPQEVFDRYSPYAAPAPVIGRDKNQHARSEIMSAIKRCIKSGRKDIFWDKRWGKVLVDLDQERLVRFFIPMNPDICCQYLVDKIRKNQTLANQGTVVNLLFLFYGNYPGAAALTMETLRESLIKHGLYYCDDNLRNLLMMLPGEYSREIEDMAHMEGKYPSVKKMLFDVSQHIRSRDGKE
jgi:hypothetical protein